MNALEKHCLNCEEPLAPEHRFCPSCGQDAADHSRNLKVLLTHFLADYFTFDNKLFRSLIPLLFRPGFLTQEYMEGRRVRYIPPLRLYLFISIVFFLLLSLQGSSGEDEMDRFFDTYLPRLFFLLLPIFALFLRLLYFSDRNLVTHFLFALYYHAFLFLTGTLLVGINALLAQFELIVVNQVLTIAFSAAWLSYLMLAMHRVYQDKGVKLILRFLALLAMYSIILIISIAIILLILNAGEWSSSSA